jgi:hypothetical protein
MNKTRACLGGQTNGSNSNLNLNQRRPVFKSPPQSLPHKGAPTQGCDSRLHLLRALRAYPQAIYHARISVWLWRGRQGCGGVVMPVASHGPYSYAHYCSSPCATHGQHGRA